MEKRLTVYDKQYWLNKGYSNIDSEKEVIRYKKECSCFNKEFWLKKGFSESESIEKVREIQIKNSKKALESKKNNKPLHVYQKEYWLNRGFTEEESLLKILESKDKSNPYKIMNDDKIKEMMNNRHKTFYSKTSEEIDNINKTKGRTKQQMIEKFGEEYVKNINDNRLFEKDEFIERFGKERYDIWRENVLNGLFNRKFNKFSKISLELFDNVVDDDIKMSCYYGKNEKCISFKDDKLYTYYVDFLYENKVIEFYGDYYHGNPNKYKEDDIIGSKYKKSLVGDKWKQDEIRINMLKNNGYDVLIIWEKEFKENKKIIIEKCKNWIKNL